MKKVETANTQLKKILSLQEQWAAAVTNLGAITNELAEGILEFCKEDAFSNLVASKYKEAALMLSHQSEIMLKGTDQTFISPIQYCLSGYNSYASKKSKWWPPKSDESKSKPLEEWYAARFESFRLPFANLIAFQALHLQNVSSVWNSLFSLIEDKKLEGLSESETAKDIVATVETLVANPLSLQYFKKFLDQDLAAENLNFILDVNAFMARHRDNRTTFEDFSCHALKIFNRYVSTKSEQQVNLDYDTVTQVTAKIATMTNNLERDEAIFSDCRRSILNLLATGVLPRFRASPLCQELYMTWRPGRVHSEELLASPILTRSKSPPPKSLLSIFIPGSSNNSERQQPSTPSSTSSSYEPLSASTSPRTPATPIDISPASSPLLRTASVMSMSLSSSPRSPSTFCTSSPSNTSTRLHMSPPLVGTRHTSPQAQAYAQAQAQQTQAQQTQAQQTQTQSSTHAHAQTQTPSQGLSSQHRVKLVNGPNNSPTPLFFTSRSSTTHMPRKSISSGSLVTEAVIAAAGTSPGSSYSSPPSATPIPGASLLRTSLDESGRGKNRRGTTATGQSPVIQRTDNDQNMLGSSLGNEPGFLVMSRSERSVHANNGRPRATTQANYNPNHQVVRSRSTTKTHQSQSGAANSTSPNSSSLSTNSKTSKISNPGSIHRSNSSGYESDGSDTFETFRIPSRESSSDSILSMSSNDNNNNVSRNSSYESLLDTAVMIEKRGEEINRHIYNGINNNYEGSTENTTNSSTTNEKDLSRSNSCDSGIASDKVSSEEEKEEKGEKQEVEEKEAIEDIVKGKEETEEKEVTEEVKEELKEEVKDEVKEEEIKEEVKEEAKETMENVANKEEEKASNEIAEATSEEKKEDGEEENKLEKEESVGNEERKDESEKEKDKEKKEENDAPTANINNNNEENTVDQPIITITEVGDNNAPPPSQEPVA